METFSAEERRRMFAYAAASFSGLQQMLDQYYESARQGGMYRWVRPPPVEGGGAG
jgi:hypothetical protein